MKFFFRSGVLFFCIFCVFGVRAQDQAVDFGSAKLQDRVLEQKVQRITHQRQLELVHEKVRQLRLDLEAGRVNVQEQQKIESIQDTSLMRDIQLLQNNLDSMQREQEQRQKSRYRAWSTTEQQLLLFEQELLELEKMLAGGVPAVGQGTDVEKEFERIKRDLERVENLNNNPEDINIPKEQEDFGGGYSSVPQEVLENYAHFILHGKKK